LWFIGETPELRIASSFRLETLQDNPYDYLLETPATRLPMPHRSRDRFSARAPVPAWATRWTSEPVPEQTLTHAWGIVIIHP
jgi:hypothetical protein